MISSYIGTDTAQLIFFASLDGTRSCFAFQLTVLMSIVWRMYVILPRILVLADIIDIHCVPSLYVIPPLIFC